LAREKKSRPAAMPQKTSINTFQIGKQPEPYKTGIVRTIVESRIFPQQILKKSRVFFGRLFK
jgi:hypothetical protein